jgi:hypothetical protein
MSHQEKYCYCIAVVTYIKKLRNSHLQNGVKTEDDSFSSQNVMHIHYSSFLIMVVALTEAEK